MTQIDLSGKTAWVTGSARNIGRAVVSEFAACGADVIVSNRENSAELESTVVDIRNRADGEVHGVQLDVGDPASVRSAVGEIHANLGDIDILVNNAAIRPHSSLSELSLDDWERVLRTNLTGPFLCTRSVIGDMVDNEWGRIISISGSDAFFGKPNRLHVATTKAGILGFTRAIAQEFAEYNITSNCIVPGVVNTDRRTGQGDPDLQTYRDHIPLGRIGDPEELAPVLSLLATDLGSYITGQEFHVNGGLFPTVRF